MTDRKASSQGKSRARQWIKPLFFLAVAALLVMALRRFAGPDRVLETVGRLVTATGDMGWRAPALFGALYIPAAVLMAPASVLTLAGGFFFGLVKGTIAVSIGSTLGAGAAFLTGRYLARGWVARKIGGNPVFAALDAALAREGWKIVGLTRLSPLFPFNLLNYAFGITGVPFSHYLLASWIGMLPGTLMYVYIGSAAGSLAQLGSGQRPVSAAQWALYAAGLAATVAVTLYVTALARRALNTKVAAGPDSTPQ
ncbi:MAG: TVP38/TMEM64 family protein [Thermodesulfobacteriota bacterium]